MVQKIPTDFVLEIASCGDFYNYAARATEEDCLCVKRHDDDAGLGLEMKPRGWGWAVGFV